MMLKIIFENGLESTCKATREEADKVINDICINNGSWITLTADNCSTTYNKNNIAMIINTLGGLKNDG